MLLFKSAIISSVFLLLSASPVTEKENSISQDEMEEYCYEISLNVDLNTSVGTIRTTVVASGCGDSPQEGLNALGEAVRGLLSEA